MKLIEPKADEELHRTLHKFMNQPRPTTTIVGLEMAENPCVYFFYDDLDRLLYIGMSTKGIQRVFQFKPDGYKSGEAKTQHILTKAARVEVIWFNSKEEAALYERMSIIQHKPVFNIQFKGARRW